MTISTGQIDGHSLTVNPRGRPLTSIFHLSLVNNRTVALLMFRSEIGQTYILRLLHLIIVYPVRGDSQCHQRRSLRSHPFSNSNKGVTADEHISELLTKEAEYFHWSCSVSFRNLCNTHRIHAQMQSLDAPTKAAEFLTAYHVTPFDGTGEFCFLILVRHNCCVRRVENFTFFIVIQSSQPLTSNLFNRWSPEIPKRRLFFSRQFTDDGAKDSRFTQQELPACKPILTPKWVILTFLVSGVIFIPIGVICLFASQGVIEIVDRYDTDCIPLSSRDNKVSFIQGVEDKRCNRTIMVTKTMKNPVYVYYQLENYYQNHRRYVKSRQDGQLRSPKDEQDVKSCVPEDSVNGEPIVPCGLVAWSLFNDTYDFTRNDQKLLVNKKGISWKSDRESKFGKNVFPKNFQKGFPIGGKSLDEKIPLSEQEDLIVWMRTAALPTFRKLYGKIDSDLQAGDTIKVLLQNNYNTYSFNGKKKLVLSTTSWLGGRNDFLGIAYLTVGSICLSLAVFFSVLYLVKPRQLGDPSYLSWNRSAGGGR